MARADFHAAPNAVTVSETAVELTYRLVLTPWLTIQPAFQWIQNAGGDPASPTIKVGQIRYEIVL